MTSWIEKHKRHCLDFALDQEHLERAVALENERARLTTQKFSQSNLHFEDELETLIVQRLKSTIEPRERIGLLCSGGEDSVYLLIILVKFLNIFPKLFCMQTKNNGRDVERLKKIALNWELDLTLFALDDLDGRMAFTRFVEHAGRQPNDLAQPVHNALYFKARDEYGCHRVIDGQFCDTVLLSNPQNHFLYWYERYPAILKYAVSAARYVPVGSNGKWQSRIAQLSKLVDTPTITATILSLINCTDVSDQSLAIVQDQLEAHGTQMAFTVLFYHGLLESRERDKYLLCPQLLSPFDDFSIAHAASGNVDQVIGPLVRKKPIRNLCKRHFPRLFLRQSTLPFELE